MYKVKKRDGTLVPFEITKIENVIKKAFKENGYLNDGDVDEIAKSIACEVYVWDEINIEEIQDQIIELLRDYDYNDIADKYIQYRGYKEALRDKVQTYLDFIENYKQSDNTANATIDANANVANHNIAVLNAEIHKPSNQDVNMRVLRDRVKQMYPDFNYKQMDIDFNTIAYLHDANSQIIMPYCVSISLYPFLLGGVKGIGGLSVAPKNIESFCGMFINMIFAIASQFKGAVATPGFLLCMDYYIRKRYGDNYCDKLDLEVLQNAIEHRTLRSQISQWFQQVTYSVNQPSSARGAQSVFWNLSFFDKPFFKGMYGDFYFPDGTKPQWESFNFLQQYYLHWLNEERLKCMLTFPVCSYALIYQNGEFADKEAADFVAQEYAEGNSFFTYISDSVDSLSSCCFSKDTKVLWKSSTKGVNLTTLEELHNMKWEPDKKNLRIFHNGSWVRGKSIKLPCRNMYKVTTFNNKEFYMTDNHINITLDGEKLTSQLTLNDYLLFNTSQLSAVPENNEHLTYSQGFVIGAFLGDGSFGQTSDKGVIYETIISQNENKYQETVRRFRSALNKMNLEPNIRVDINENNVYNVRISCKELVEFIRNWTNWYRGTYSYNKQLNLDCLLQSVDFRRGILAGWYATDGGNSNRCYTTSEKLAEGMEVLITSLGMQSIINISDRTNEKVIIRGKEYERHYPLICVRWYEDANHRQNKDKDHSWIKYNNGIYFKIKSIEHVEYNDDVYCIESGNKNEPYFTLPCGLITHNCRLQNKLSDNTFSFTNGQIGEQTGSLNVITLNMNRIVQDYKKQDELGFYDYLSNILERIYKYQIAYKSILVDMKEAQLFPAYDNGFINMDRQYLTIGVNGLNQAAEFLGIKCTNNDEYAEFCHRVFGTIKEQNTLHKDKGLMFNTEQTPCENAAIKLYNRDKKDGYWVPEDTNLYASYVYKPNDESVSVLDKFVMHGDKFLGSFCDGGQAAHINLDSHLDKIQYELLLKYAGRVGCKYFTFNIPNCECENCGFIAKHPFKQCPKCGSTNVSLWDRVIGYLVKIKNWSKGRQIEQKTRIYSKL